MPAAFSSVVHKTDPVSFSKKLTSDEQDLGVKFRSQDSSGSEPRPGIQRSRVEDSFGHEPLLLLVLHKAPPCLLLYHLQPLPCTSSFRAICKQATPSGPLAQPPLQARLCVPLPI